MLRDLPWKVVVGSALGGFVLGLALFWWPGPLAQAASGPPLPRLFQSPQYRLVNQLDQPVSSTAFLGKVQIVVVMDPYCTALCPLTTSKVLNLEQTLRRRHLADKVQFVSFDINKATGPKVMRSFLEQEGVNPNAHWLQYLTGSPGAIQKAVTTGYRISYQGVSAATLDKVLPSAFQARMRNGVAERARASFDIDHEDPLFVVDQHGWVRALYGSASTTPTQEVVSDVAELVRAPG